MKKYDFKKICKNLENKILKAINSNTPPRNKDIDKLRFLREQWEKSENKKGLGK